MRPPSSFGKTEGLEEEAETYRMSRMSQASGEVGSPQREGRCIKETNQAAVSRSVQGALFLNMLI